jgi:hypothetical protein
MEMEIPHGLEKAELEFVFSITAPFFWVLRDSNGNEKMKNGSLFFMDVGKGVFAVTASHVVEECLKDTRSPKFVQCMIGGHGPGHTVYLHLNDRVIASHCEIDIATLRVTRAEVELTGRSILTGCQEEWPPRLADINCGLTYCGLPGKERQWLARRELDFGYVTMAGYATNAHETCISIQIERDKLMPVFGKGNLPGNYDFRGMSGGPVLAIVETPALRLWKPAGVIFQGPNRDPAESIQGLEIIRARPVHFINPDGTLDIARWEQSGGCSHTIFP